jgi:putative Mg2+ transporter-C (MgtC) family protein
LKDEGVHIDDTQLALRVLVAFGLTFVLGYERQLRGSPAGDRTFSLIGVATGVIGALSANNAPNALAGAVTGIGFIGGGLVFHQAMRNHQVVRGVTTAAAIFATAAIGAAAGEGKFELAAVATGLVLVALEIRYLPGLRAADARRWAPRFTPDDEYDPADPPADDDGHPRQLNRSPPHQR